MSKRSRVNRADSFDQPNYPNKNSSFSKPSALSNNVVAATAAATTSSAVEETQYISEFLKECVLCKSILKLKNDTYMYNSNPYCTEECRQIQMDLDEELEKKQLEESGKKMEERLITSS
ncbi:FCS-Like Zinc finger 1-like [Solanum dulcamara]|uniref:FCS-Like Zinc finger 1-like n=1 Tax=Solanum dulcamara TaxID=45834 RepID=UPI002485B86E|nr:FCS-Like Zinc finger 1-like [Solanum dulcamara]